MRNILLYSILLCLFLVNIAEAGIRWTPPTEYLPPERLDMLLQKWDQLAHSEDLWDRDGALALVTDMIPRGGRFSGAFFCAFDNPEIIDRVVDLFLEEVTRVQSGRRTLAQGSNDHGDGEYLMALAEVAESTFDPRLYDDMLHINLHFSQGFRNLYLAMVYPERTLDYLFEKDENDWQHWEEVRRAFVTLSYMTAESPETLRAERRRAFTFVAENGRHFAEMVLPVHDYYARSDSLDVLELIGTVSEVPLVEKIIHDANEVDLRKIRGWYGRRLDTYLDRGYEQIQDKGQRIIEILRQRSPSQR